MSRLEKTLYYTKYTLWSYADALSSIPIWISEMLDPKIATASYPNFLKCSQSKIPSTTIIEEFLLTSSNL